VENPYGILVEKPLGKVHLEDQELNKEIERGDGCMRIRCGENSFRI
jgi:hypothetical protein